MDREGIFKVVGEADQFGENTNFRKLCNQMVRSVVSSGKWFSFCTKIAKEQVDIMGIKNDKGISLGNMINDYYEDMVYRPAVYKYLLQDYLCYYESPAVVKDRNTAGFKNSFNKYLITSNIGVVAEWLNIPYEDAFAQYNKFEGYEADTGNLIPYYKLYVTKEGVRKITKPRSDLDVSEKGTRILPLFALETGVELLYQKLLTGTYDVTFVKDSGQVRIINTTFSEEKIREVYKDEEYVSNAMNSWFNGVFKENPNMERGYIRVMEMGGSIYDSPTRSINYARLVKFEEADPDLSFINIDLDSVMVEFKQRVLQNQDININIKEVVETLDVFEVGTSRKINGNVEINSVSSLVLWAEGQYVLLSTVFLRSLALFMLGNPQWFEGYTGRPYVGNGLDTANWDDDELDIG